MKSIKDVSIDKIYDDTFDMDLSNLYGLCNAELGLQQSKRDQIIAFYIAIISFLVPAIIDLELPYLPQSVAYFLLWVIGIILCAVVRRYRIYKEAYWLTLRTISTLMRVKKNRLDEHMIRRLFWETMKVMQPKVVSTHKNSDDQICPDFNATRKKNSTSAEFLLYRLLSVIAAVVLLIAVYTLSFGFFTEYAKNLPEEAAIVLSVLLACIPAIYSHHRCIRAFVGDLINVYQFCFDDDLNSFEKTYAKAWFLHCSIEEPDENDKEEDIKEDEKQA